MDVTPQIAQGRPVIQSYGPDGFKVSDQLYSGSIILMHDVVQDWPVANSQHISLERLSPILAQVDDIELLLIGCGQAFCLIPPDIKAAFRRKGITIDAMDTGEACRTYSVLMAEERRVAAALIKI